MNTDLLSIPVKPGTFVTTGVMLPYGSRVTEGLVDKRFVVIGYTHRDNLYTANTLFEVAVQNISEETCRLAVLLTYDDAHADIRIDLERGIEPEPEALKTLASTRDLPLTFGALEIEDVA